MPFRTLTLFYARGQHVPLCSSPYRTTYCAAFGPAVAIRGMRGIVKVIVFPHDIVRVFQRDKAISVVVATTTL